MSIITKTIHNQEYMLFEGGYTKEQAKTRVQQLRVMEQNKHRGYGGFTRTVPYEGKYAVFIAISKPHIKRLIFKMSSAIGNMGRMELIDALAKQAGITQVESCPLARKALEGDTEVWYCWPKDAPEAYGRCQFEGLDVGDKCNTLYNVVW